MGRGDLSKSRFVETLGQKRYEKTRLRLSVRLYPLMGKDTKFAVRMARNPIKPTREDIEARGRACPTESLLMSFASSIHGRDRPLCTSWRRTQGDTS